MRDENFIIEVNGKKINCEMFYTFEKNGNNYMIYTDHILDESGEERLLAAKYIIDNNKVTLNDNLSKEEYDMIDKEMEKYINA